MTEQLGSDVFIVDDDVSVRDTLAAAFTLQGYRVTCFAEGNSFLAAARGQTPACVLLDAHMPGFSGLDILRDIDSRRFCAPIFVTAVQRDISMAVEAIRNGAFGFIQKPFDPEAVVARVRAAIERFSRRSGGGISPRALNVGRCERLTPREREVLAQIAGGASNREAGRQLGISPRTIEVHRAHIMEKLGARNIADLMRIVLTERGAG
jgi:FixJ family two-component response regulator